VRGLARLEVLQVQLPPYLVWDAGGIDAILLVQHGPGCRLPLLEIHRPASADRQNQLDMRLDCGDHLARLGRMALPDEKRSTRLDFETNNTLLSDG
jgi:hypothetical protein